MPVQHFHPSVANWFRGAFPGPTDAQVAAWPSIRAGLDTLVAAPTGSGKTLTAFMAAIDALVRRGLAAGGLPDETMVVYVSPLKALSNDIRLNLEAPLDGIRAELQKLGLPDVGIRTAVRTGDTPARERRQAIRKPPHVLVTTPESLYVLLGSVSGRGMLKSVRTVIVDEIHAMAASKRGSHLALSLERLQALIDQRADDGADVIGTQQRLTRIGLSATQKPIDEVARFLVGAGAVTEGVADCVIVDIGYGKQRDLALELPMTPLSAIMSNDQWTEVYLKLADLIANHSTTLVFVNTRRMAERTSRHLADLLGKDKVAAHHGSLSKETRLDAEQRLKRGELKVLVATASLELGLDVGDVDLVCQLGSPRSIATFLQRAGRSGHAVGGVPKARLFPQTRDELVECAALLDCVRRGELDTLHVLPAPLDVLAQQIVAETSCREWGEDELFALVKRAWPYAHLKRADFDAVVRMLSDGFMTRHGQRAGYVHRDGVNHRLRERKGSRMAALMSGGTIPETGDYTVVLEPQADKIGSVHEDFAVESLAGDVFQLGNTSYRILRIEPGRVRVEDADGAAPNIPFWLGEAPGRTDELSFGVSRLRADIEEWLALNGYENTVARLVQELALDEAAALQIVDYLARTMTALGALPTRNLIVLERFFDESGGMQLVIHSVFGSRINRAWGLALHKRFCRKFNFELQAAATEDAIVLSLSTSHSFALDEVVRYLHSATALDVLTQALLDAPLFGVRWRWNATTALALPRFTGGRKVAPQLQRMKSEDLLASVFPDQVACAENIVGEREVPNHPLVAQTLYDCLYDAMDSQGWLQLLRRLESGDIDVLARDLPAPSPLAAEALNARPYAYLDDAPIEERRTQAVRGRGHGDVAQGDDPGRLEADAIDSVRLEAWPQPRSADEMHEALNGLGVITDDEVLEADVDGRADVDTDGGALTAAESSAHPVGGGEAAHAPVPGGRFRPIERGWAIFLSELVSAGRATRLVVTSAEIGEAGLWVAAERVSQIAVLYPDAAMSPSIAVPAEFRIPGGTSASASASGMDSPTAAGMDVHVDLHADVHAGVADEHEVAELVVGSELAFEALRELLRSRLGGLGPATVSELSCQLMLPAADIEAALEALQTEGTVLRGRFTSASYGDGDAEWCERHLLARIHRYTLKRLRREIEPVEPRDFVRFLFDWQHVGSDSRVSGPEALSGVLSQLEGYEAPAASWESEILPCRVTDYSSAWLDDLCTSGRALWARLRPTSEGRAGGANSLRSTPILLLPRRLSSTWTRLATVKAASRSSSLRTNFPKKSASAAVAAGGAGADAPALSADHKLHSRAVRVLAFLATSGASFFDEISLGTRLLQSELEEALTELVVAGRISCDSFAGLRALLVPASKRASTSSSSRGRRRMPLFTIADAGRWSLTRAADVTIDRHIAGIDDSANAANADAADAVEHAARTLLRRYGVMCWQMIEREASWLPAWRDLVRVYRRLEARGEIRGGRFIAGVSGEQFALPEAVASMREWRRRPADDAFICLCAADPANLLGTVVPGPKIPRVAGSRVVYRNGLPLATLVAGQVDMLQSLSPEQEQTARKLLSLDPSFRFLAAPSRQPDRLDETLHAKPPGSR